MTNPNPTSPDPGQPVGALPSVEDVMRLVSPLPMSVATWDELWSAVSRLHAAAVHAQALAVIAKSHCPLEARDGVTVKYFRCGCGATDTTKEACPVAAYQASLAAKESETR